MVSPQFITGLAYGGAGGLILGVVITACVFFRMESREQARQQREVEERAARQKAAMAASNWPAANDDGHPVSARRELRRSPR